MWLSFKTNTGRSGGVPNGPGIDDVPGVSVVDERRYAPATTAFARDGSVTYRSPSTGCGVVDIILPYLKGCRLGPLPGGSRVLQAQVRRKLTRTEAHHRSASALFRGQVGTEVLVHLEHTHGLLAKDLGELTVRVNLALIFSVLKVVLLDVVPDFADYLAAGKVIVADNLGQIRGRGHRRGDAAPRPRAGLPTPSFCVAAVSSLPRFSVDRAIFYLRGICSITDGRPGISAPSL